MPDQMSKIERELGALGEFSRRSEKQYEKIVEAIDRFSEVLPSLLMNTKRMNSVDNKISVVRDEMSVLKTTIAVMEERQSKTDKIIYGVLTLVLSAVVMTGMQFITVKG